MAENGRLPDSALKAIPDGRLAADGAAQSWNAGPAQAGLRPLGPDSSYRSYERQVYWRNYWCGRGACGNAAVPGTSNHGWGHAVDLADPSWMKEWIIEHGHKYGWYWGEASWEPWHVTYDGSWDGVAVFKPLRKGSRGARVVRLHKLLRHAGGALRHPRPGRYWDVDWPYSRKFGWRTERRVKRFQKDHSLKQDGIVGAKTWAKLKEIGRKDIA